MKSIEELTVGRNARKYIGDNVFKMHMKLSNLIRYAGFGISDIYKSSAKFGLHFSSIQLIRQQLRNTI